MKALILIKFNRILFNSSYEIQEYEILYLNPHYITEISKPFLNLPDVYSINLANGNYYYVEKNDYLNQLEEANIKLERNKI